MSLLFPSRCIFCGEWISEKMGGLCKECREQAEEDSKTVYCTPPENIDGLVCAGRYRGSLKRAVIHMKFHEYGSRNLLPLVQLMAQAWALHKMPEPDIIIGVPISPLRLRTRGYNQSEEMAKLLANMWNIPFVPVLRRRMLSQMQSKLTADKRWDNARRSFYLRRNIRLEGKAVLLVDDIVTTGATASSCAALLRKAGAQSVWVLAAAKAGA
ncbi:MAG: ComF family protein [Clostridia bacterium]|nr:ComF family protein [Clostridia bacterium]